MITIRIHKTQYYIIREKLMINYSLHFLTDNDYRVNFDLQN